MTFVLFEYFSTIKTNKQAVNAVNPLKKHDSKNDVGNLQSFLKTSPCFSKVTVYRVL